MKSRIWFLLILPFIVTSCFKDEDSIGCTDEKASNYSSLAIKNDGSCKYKAPPIKTGNIIIWQDSLSSVNLIHNGSTELYLYLNNSLVDSCHANQYLDKDPLCNIGLGIMDNQYYIEDKYSEEVHYDIRDQTGTVIDYGSRYISPGGCTSVKMD